jgi:hypothetical protein
LNLVLFTIFGVALVSVKRIHVYLLGDERLYCPFCGREINYEEPCKYVVFIATRLRDEPEYYVFEILEMLEKEPWRGDELLFTYTSSRHRGLYERVYGKLPAYTQEDYVERGSIKIEDAVKLLESNVQSKSDIILFEVLTRARWGGYGGPMYEYVEFIALLKEGF